MGPEKTFCRGQKFWQPTGSSSLATVIQGNSNNFSREYQGTHPNNLLIGYNNLKSALTDNPEGGNSLTWAIYMYVCAAPKGMAFSSFGHK